MSFHISARELALCSFIFFTSVAFGQEASAPITTFHSESTVVTVPTLVLQQDGSVLFGLRAKDFAVRDNGVIQSVNLDDAADTDPVSLVVVVQRGHGASRVLESEGCHPKPYDDYSATPKKKCVSALHGIGLMLETFLHAPGSQMAIVTFDSAVKLQQPFSSDISGITKKLSQLPEGDTGDAILDAMDFSLNMLDQSPKHWRRIIVLISEMRDHGSHNITYEETAKRITATETEFYSITFSDDTDALAKFLQASMGQPGGRGGNAGGMPGGAGGGMSGGMGGAGGGMGGGMGGGPGGGMGGGMSGGGMGGSMSGGPGGSMGGGMPGGGLMRLFGPQAFQLVPMIVPLMQMAAEEMKVNVPQGIADLTGGEYIYFADPRSFETALGFLANHVHNRYQLSFRPSNPTPGAHKVDVSLVKSLDGVYVAARKGYWLKRHDVVKQSAAEEQPEPAKDSVKPAAATVDTPSVQAPTTAPAR